MKERIAKILCYVFHKPNKCSVKPINPRENQLDKKYTCDFPLGYKILIKSDKYDQYYIGEKEFMKDWMIIEYFGELEFKYNGIIKTKFNGKPVIYK